MGHFRGFGGFSVKTEDNLSLSHARRTTPSYTPRPTTPVAPKARLRASLGAGAAATPLLGVPYALLGAPFWGPALRAPQRGHLVGTSGSKRLQNRPNAQNGHFGRFWGHLLPLVPTKRPFWDPALRAPQNGYFATCWVQQTPS